MAKTAEQTAMRVSRNSIVWNVVLAAFKLFAGIFARSAAMLSDAVHTLSDVLSTIIVMVGVRMANRESDKDHPYGHERFECVAAIILAVILFATGLGIGYGGLQKILAGSYEALAVPGALALVAAVLSIIIKEGMYHYTRAAAKSIGSGALMADAWHHRSDAFSSIGSFAGILGARLGFPVLDSLACIVICLFILKAALTIFMDSINRMTDTACSETLTANIRQVIEAQEGVAGIDLLQTRLFGNKVYVDVEISADGDATLRQTHAAAQRVHDAIEAAFPEVKHCMVHVNPLEKPSDSPAT